MKKLFPLLLAGLLAFGFMGCASNLEISTSGLTVGLTRIERTSDGAVHVTWRVSNPNVVSYLLAKSTHKVTLNGTVVGTLNEDSRVGVPAQTQLENTARLIPAGPGSSAIIDQAIAQGSAAYRLESVITVLLIDDNFEKFRLSGSGDVPVTAK